MRPSTLQMTTTFEPQHRVLGGWERRDPWQGPGGLISLVGGRNCLRPDRGTQTGVVQPLSWEPESGIRGLALFLIEWRSNQGVGDIKGSRSLRVGPAFCPPLHLRFQNRLYKNVGNLPPPLR